MAFLPYPTPRGSLLDLIVERLRRIAMADWIKMLGSAAIAVALAYSMLQQHDYRINKLEDNFEQHLLKHDAQTAEIQQTMKRIEIELTRLQR